MIRLSIKIEPADATSNILFITGSSGSTTKTLLRIYLVFRDIYDDVKLLDRYGDYGTIYLSTLKLHSFGCDINKFSQVIMEIKICITKIKVTITTTSLI